MGKGKARRAMCQVTAEQLNRLTSLGPQVGHGTLFLFSPGFNRVISGCLDSNIKGATWSPG